MKTLYMLWVLTLVPLLSVTDANAQELTERYIPIGKSPGLSGKHTSIGTVDTVNVQGGTLISANSSGVTSVKVDKNTRIWLDRSKQGLTNLKCSLGECRRGQIVEVKFRNNDRANGVAEWIKVEATQPGGK